MRDLARDSLLPSGRVGRPYCYRCHKPRATCVCSLLQPVEHDTEVLIIQHPREQHHPIGSVRIAALGLARCRVEVASNQAGGELRIEGPLPKGAALLYPGADALPLETWTGPQRPRALVLLDGTWSTVKRLYAGDPRLWTLPKVRLTPDRPGHYRIRREPRADYLSTLEALTEALSLLEPERRASWDTLRAAFDAMIDRQIALSRAQPRRRVARNIPQYRAIPAELHREHGPVVIVHVETTQRNRLGLPGTRRRRQLVRLCALRLTMSSTEAFDVVVDIEGDPPTPSHLERMGLSDAELARGCSEVELGELWAAFTRPTDRVCAWNQLNLDLLPEPLDARSGYVLKGIYADERRVRAGHVEAACAREGCTIDAMHDADLAALPYAAQTWGRAGDRLAATVAMYRWLEARAKPVRGVTSSVT